MRTRSGAACPTCWRHLDNLTGRFGLPAVVAINRFPTDSEEEVDAVAEACGAHGAKAIVSDVFAQGGAGATDLALEVVRLAETGPVPARFTYADDDRLTEKIRKGRAAAVRRQRRRLRTAGAGETGSS